MRTLAALAVIAGGLAGQTAPFGNARVESITQIINNGARARYSPAGDQLIFDRRNPDGLYDLYVADPAGQPTGSLSEGKPVGQLHNGNGVYHPSGAFIAFVSQETQHFLSFLSPFSWLAIGEPGVGLFNNLWFTDGAAYWKATNIPLKQTADDGIPVYATVNPRFLPDGQRIVWTERYAEGGNFNWGKWRIKIADLVYTPSPKSFGLANERVLFTPANGTYVTAIAVLRPGFLLLSGNLDGQHEFGMDLYSFNILTGALVNLTNSPTHWEEGACVASSGKIVYMTNRDSRVQLDFNRDWPGQPVERDYYVMDSTGANKERLTYFNDSTKREYTTWRSVPIICNFSPDNRTIAATIGRDYGDDLISRIIWQVSLIRLKAPL